MENECLNPQIVAHYSEIRFYKKMIKELEVKIYELQLEIDYLKRLLTLHHIKYE